MQAEAAEHLETMLYRKNGTRKKVGTLTTKNKKRASFEMPLNY
jgi:hypothetical protein